MIRKSQSSEADYITTLKPLVTQFRRLNRPEIHAIKTKGAAKEFLKRAIAPVSAEYSVEPVDKKAYDKMEATWAKRHTEDQPPSVMIQTHSAVRGAAKFLKDQRQTLRFCTSAQSNIAAAYYTRINEGGPSDAESNTSKDGDADADADAPHSKTNADNTSSKNADANGGAEAEAEAKAKAEADANTPEPEAKNARSPKATGSKTLSAKVSTEPSGAAAVPTTKRKTCKPARKGSSAALRFPLHSSSDSDGDRRSDVNYEPRSSSGYESDTQSGSDSDSSSESDSDQKRVPKRKAKQSASQVTATDVKAERSLDELQRAMCNGLSESQRKAFENLLTGSTGTEFTKSHLHLLNTRLFN